MKPMGTFRVAFDIGDTNGQRWECLDAVVDTGASYTWAPRGILGRLAVRPQFRRSFVTADGRTIEREMAVTMARWQGQILPTLVVFGEEDSRPLLGAYTLEGFGLAPDPVNRRLIHVPGLALATAGSGPLEFLDLRGQRRHDVTIVAHQSEVSQREDGRLIVAVDRHDGACP